jgi:hypothetical protein
MDEPSVRRPPWATRCVGGRAGRWAPLGGRPRRCGRALEPSGAPSLCSRTWQASARWRRRPRRPAVGVRRLTTGRGTPGSRLGRTRTRRSACCRGAGAAIR